MRKHVIPSERGESRDLTAQVRRGFLDSLRSLGMTLP
jgi:hypothetical protein